MEKVVNEAHRSKFQTLEQFYTSEDLLVFDIETTGFTAEHTALYLIGCAYYKNRQWNICQWFNQDGRSEADILEQFLSFAKNYKYVITYNEMDSIFRISLKRQRHMGWKIHSPIWKALIFISTSVF